MKKIKNCNILKEQQSIISTNSPTTYLRGSSIPDKFYHNVVIYNYEIQCGGSELKKLSKR